MKLIISMIVTLVAVGCSNSNEIQTLRDKNVQLQAKLKAKREKAAEALGKLKGQPSEVIKRKGGALFKITLEEGE